MPTLYLADTPPLTKPMTNTELIIQHRLSNRKTFTHPNVGDFIAIHPIDSRVKPYTRITYVHSDGLVQTGGNEHSSVYLNSDGSGSYSGSLDTGVQLEDLIPSSETKDGCIWIFEDNIAGAGRGIYKHVPMRIFHLKPSATIPCHFRSPYSLFKHRENHTFEIRKSESYVTTLQTETDVYQWAKDNDLTITIRKNWPSAVFYYPQARHNPSITTSPINSGTSLPALP